MTIPVISVIIIFTPIAKHVKPIYSMKLPYMNVGIGQIHPDIDSEYLINDVWWKKPIAVVNEDHEFKISSLVLSPVGQF